MKSILIFFGLLCPSREMNVHKKDGSTSVRSYKEYRSLPEWHHKQYDTVGDMRVWMRRGLDGKTVFLMRRIDTFKVKKPL